MMLSDLDIPHGPEHNAWYKLETKNSFSCEDDLAVAGSRWVLLRGQEDLWVFSKYAPQMGLSLTWAERLAPAFPPSAAGQIQESEENPSATPALFPLTSPQARGAQFLGQDSGLSKHISLMCSTLPGHCRRRALG